MADTSEVLVGFHVYLYLFLCIYVLLNMSFITIYVTLTKNSPIFFLPLLILQWRPSQRNKQPAKYGLR